MYIDAFNHIVAFFALNRAIRVVDYLLRSSLQKSSKAGDILCHWQTKYCDALCERLCDNNK